jgi:hypothetical protein
MEFKAVIKKAANVDWMAHRPSRSQRTRKTWEKLIASLKIGTEDMLHTPVELKDEEELVKIEV